MAIRPVSTSVAVGPTRVHLFQVVREHRAGGDEEWIVVGFTDDRVDLASVGFEWHRVVPLADFAAGPFEPVYAGGVPVWGY